MEIVLTYMFVVISYFGCIDDNVQYSYVANENGNGVKMLMTIDRNTDCIRSDVTGVVLQPNVSLVDGFIDRSYAGSSNEIWYVYVPVIEQTGTFSVVEPLEE